MKDSDSINIPVPRDLVHHALRIAHNITRQHAAGGLALHGKPGQSAMQGVFQGPVASNVPGRTDRHNHDVPAGSYVVPADVVSILGEGNTKAGFTQLTAAFAPLDIMGGMKLQPGKPMAGRGVKKPGLNLSLPKAPKPPEARGRGRADGGSANGGDTVPIIDAGGEYVIPPHQLVQKYGNLDKAHDIMDKIVGLLRQREIERLKTAPPPKR